MTRVIKTRNYKLIHSAEHSVVTEIYSILNNVSFSNLLQGHKVKDLVISGFKKKESSETLIRNAANICKPAEQNMELPGETGALAKS